MCCSSSTPQFFSMLGLYRQVPRCGPETSDPRATLGRLDIWDAWCCFFGRRPRRHDDRGQRFIRPHFAKHDGQGAVDIPAGIAVLQLRSAYRACVHSSGLPSAGKKSSSRRNQTPPRQLGHRARFPLGARARSPIALYTSGDFGPPGTLLTAPCIS